MARYPIGSAGANTASAAMGVSSSASTIPAEAGVYKMPVKIEGYKQIRCDWYASDGLTKLLDETKIARVEIPAYATIVRPEEHEFWAVYPTLRTNEYSMVEIEGLRPFGFSQCRSLFDPSYAYKVGSTYRTRVNEDVKNRTSYGLHFYLNRKDAE